MYSNSEAGQDTCMCFGCPVSDASLSQRDSKSPPLKSAPNRAYKNLRWTFQILDCNIWPKAKSYFFSFVYNFKKKKILKISTFLWPPTCLFTQTKPVTGMIMPDITRRCPDYKKLFMLINIQSGQQQWTAKIMCSREPYVSRQDRSSGYRNRPSWVLIYF